MKWQPTRNKDYTYRDDFCRGKCPRFVDDATLSIRLSGKLDSKSDLNLTFTPHIKECSLLKAKNDKSIVCMLSCPIFEAYKNSNSY